MFKEDPILNFIYLLKLKSNKLSNYVEIIVYGNVQGLITIIYIKHFQRRL